MTVYRKYADLLLDANSGIASDRMKVGIAKNTLIGFVHARDDEPQGIAVYLLNKRLVVIYDDDTARVEATTADLTFTTQSRINAAIVPLGFRIISRANRWYVLNVETKETREYASGVTLTRDTKETV